MFFLQEGMGSGPYLVLLGFILLIAILLIAFILSVIVKNKVSIKKGDVEIDSIRKVEKNNLPGNAIEKKGLNILLTITVVIIIISVLVLLNWVCSIKLD